MKSLFSSAVRPAAGRIFVRAVLWGVLLFAAGAALAGQHAILMSGFNDAGFQADLSHAYILLQENGYDDGEIFVLYHTGDSLDLDGDGDDDVDGNCDSAEDIFAAFDAIEGVVAAGDPVFFLGTGHGMSDNRGAHGYPNSGIFTKDRLDTLWDFEVAERFRDLDDAVGSSVRKICLIPVCRGGGFINSYPAEKEDVLDSLPQVSVSTSVKYFQNATYYASGYPLTYWWTSALRGADWTGNPVDADGNNDMCVSLFEAFAFAKNKIDAEGGDPLHYATGCFLDHVTEFSGAWCDLPIPVINMICCPETGPPPWGPRDCGGLGLTVKTSLGKGTVEVRTRAANAGTAPSDVALLQYFYRAPTLALGFYYDTGWQYAASGPLPPMLPGDTLDLEPVAFTLPDLNPFGEPYWTVGARIEDPYVPIGSGWLDDDPRVKMANDWTIDTAPGILHQVHFYAVNPMPEPARVVLTLDTSDYPPDWFVHLSPPQDDTLAFAPGASLVVTLTLRSLGVSHCLGSARVYETLLPYEGYSPCTDPDCGDESCGGHIRVTGGCTVTLNTQITAVEEGSDRRTSALLSVLPSVFAKETRIQLSLPIASPVHLGVYDVTGRLVRTIARVPLSAGDHAYVWDGRDDRGRPAPPACYFVRAETGELRSVRKVVKAD